MSGDLGGHFNNALSSLLVRPIQHCGKCSFRYLLTSLWKRGSSKPQKAQIELVGAMLTNLCTQERLIFHKLGVSSSFQANFDHSLYQE
ncbi:hypothetical protein TNCV_30861 [Trichonephila clavipes]|nr:hypothetical protein TNCV_30861 [Trichonephila clavipes]